MPAAPQWQLNMEGTAKFHTETELGEPGGSTVVGVHACNMESGLNVTLELSSKPFMSMVTVRHKMQP